MYAYDFDDVNYTRLSYLESTGTQYIETNDLVTATSSMEIMCTFTKLFSYNMAAGVWNLLAASTTSTGNSCLAAAGTSNNNISTTQLALNTPYSIKLGPLYGGALINDKVVLSSTSNNTASTKATITLFAAKDDGTVNSSGSNVPMASAWGGSYGYVRIFYCELYVSATTTRLLVPAKRKSDSVLGMYDEVSKTFYTNAGTGTFVAGPVIAEIDKLAIDTRNIPGRYLEKNYFLPPVSTGYEVNESSTEGLVTILNGGLVAHGGIKGTKVYNAVWNDFVDRIPVDDDCKLEYGKCYCFDGEKYTQTSSYMQGNIIGIHSDTFGFECGYKGKTKELGCSVAGFVLAYVDANYKPGTPLTCTANGFLTKISDEDKREYPERIVALYWKPENSRYWGSDNKKVLVKGRKWVKVRR